ncbi:putative membrane protein [Spinactinospora alkalitolerans]|uniref:Putative membrane protein n=1 Tax=Spinactinospora alkalitolerans TaxID=687207 RepID=A0A852TRE6_9ACTN|nr:DUF1772 domain-containing protein [Spinactinospora alkalitolerans]NYE45412.1 putative membrane protein [Spinactinospora alkalitolerans]
MVHNALSLVSVLGTGIVAGVFFAVAVSVLPALAAMEPGRYIVTHRALGKGYHPHMPLIVTVALLADATLVFLAPVPAARLLFAVAGVCLVGVQVVSQFGNVPINRRVGRTPTDPVPEEWDDPRPLWRRWHTLRTVFAVLALLATGCAILVAS